MAQTSIRLLGKDNDILARAKALLPIPRLGQRTSGKWIIRGRSCAWEKRQFSQDGNVDASIAPRKFLVPGSTPAQKECSRDEVRGRLLGKPEVFPKCAIIL
jgi:hypothetical protein